jgi:hypothetical protein
MSSAVWPLAACLVTGAALYVTRGVLDQVVVGGRASRVALLPPWPAFAGFVALAAIALLLLDRARRRTHSDARLRDLVGPALAPALLLVPFLPWAADAMPALQMLAGPLRGVVWLAAGGLMAWVLWHAGVIGGGWFARQSAAAQAVMIAVIVALLGGTVAARLARTTLFPAGDEPHYLVIAQSLWRDGDLKIENNHQRGDYREYYPRDLEPHYLTRGSDGEIYSVHPVGLPVLLAPVYAAGGYEAVVALLILMAAAAAALAWRWTAAVLASPAAATFAVVAITASAPFLLNTFTVYPEIAAALAVMVALTAKRPWAIGLACGVLPWLSTKYAPMSAALLLTALVRGSGTMSLKSVTDAAIRMGAGLSIPYLTLLALWFTFFYAYWGSPLPQAPYGALTQTTPWNLVFGAPGLLFDQEYGLLPYAPVYILAATGLWAMWRSGGETRTWAIVVTVVFAALLGTVGAFRIWWGGAAAPARPLASGLLVLALPMAAAYREAPAGSARRAAQHLLLLVGVAIAITMTMAQGGLLINNGRDGTSSLLEWWSPRWEAWTLAPSFLHHEAPTALLHSAFWLGAAALAALWLRRLRVTTPAMAALAAMLVFSGALGAIAVLFPLLPADPPQPRVNLLARPRSAALDAFDVHALPAALIYEGPIYLPVRKTAAADIVDRFTLEVEMGQRPDPQPVRILHNGRFSLPAGRYRLDVEWSDRPARGPLPLGLQIGRIGPPMITWPVDPASADRWRTDFSLPVDAAFVGFRGSVDLERAIQRITIVPSAIVDRGLRPPLPQVLSASRYGSAAVYFHDEQLFPEAAGFWTIGRRRAAVTMAPAGEAPARLRIHCGSKANRVTLRSHGWSQTLDMVPNRPQEVTLPAATRGIVTLEIETADGFVPSEIDPASQDRRFLGAWVEVM